GSEGGMGVQPGQAGRVRFNTPVRLVVVRRGHQRVWHTFPEPRRVVALPWKIAHSPFGRAEVQAASRPWQKLSRPFRITWFPLGRGLTAHIRPVPGTEITPAHPITLIFSAPVQRVLEGQMPTITPAVEGDWKVVDSHTLRFEPKGLAYPFGARVRLARPNAVSDAPGAAEPPQNVLTWQVPQPSPVRATQLLAQLGWLPLRFTPDSPVGPTRLHQLAAVT